MNEWTGGRGFPLLREFLYYKGKTKTINFEGLLAFAPGAVLIMSPAL